jgi:hypothetical protein
MEKEFIPYEQALELKELGFDEPCMAFYEPGNKEVKVVGVNQRYNDPSLLTVTDFCAPLYQQAFRWFRDKYFIDAEIYLNHELGHKFYHYLILQLVRENIEWKSRNITKFKTYEEAGLACLKKLIEIVKEVKEDKIGEYFAKNADIKIEMNKNERK